MTNPNPATPPQGATPGSGEHGSTPPAGTPAPATQAPGNNNAGMVTIPVEEFAKLQRDAARTRSFGSRVFKKPTNQPANVNPDDPNAAALLEAQAGREAAERKAMQLEVRGKVRDLLADARFKDLPKSTKDLILDKPHMLTEADSLEEALYDIEDKLIEMAGGIVPSNQPNNQPLPSNNQPANRETPPTVTPGAPAPVDAAVLEDTSNLRGTARSVAVLGNAFKKQLGGVKQS